MAGQPPEPSFQPSGQDPGLTQGRPSWQQPTTYTPPAGNGGQQPPYAAPSYSQEPAYTPQEPTYTPQEQPYAAQEQQPYGGQDQTYAGQDQAYAVGQGQGQARVQAQEYPGYQGYQPPSYGAQPGQGQAQGQPIPPPQWQGIAGVTPAAPPKTKQHGERGFIGSLFDFSFDTFVTPKIIKVLYVLVTIWTALIALIILVIGFKTGGLAGGLFTLIVVEPIFVLLTLGVYRVVLEAFMVVFRIYEETKKISGNSDKQA
jgi:hypothetical protein